MHDSSDDHCHLLTDVTSPSAAGRWEPVALADAALWWAGLPLLGTALRARAGGRAAERRGCWKGGTGGGATESGRWEGRRCCAFFHAICGRCEGAVGRGRSGC